MINIAGTIGAGKSSLASIIGEELGSKVYYEDVEDNPVIKLFYQGNKIADEYRKVQGGNMKNPYAFLMQTDFLNNSYKRMKLAGGTINGIIDRTIYENKLFMELNYEMGNVSKVELDVYDEIYNNYLYDLKEGHYVNPRKDLMIYIDIDIHTMLDHVKKRGRDYEQVEEDSSLMTYYEALLEKYNCWADSFSGRVLRINANELDYVNDEADRKYVIDSIRKELSLINYI